MGTDLLIASAIVLGLMATWYGLQGWVRRHVPGVAESADILEGRWGCRGCFLTSSCDRDEECPRG